jgi:hypothetical protein
VASTRTVTTFLPPQFATSVMSYLKPLYPPSWCPTNHPLTITVQSRYTPSNSSQSLLPASDAGRSKVRRYHPVLFCGKPSPMALNPWEPSAVRSNGSSIAQSCGRSTRRQLASL